MPIRNDAASAATVTRAKASAELEALILRLAPQHVAVDEGAPSPFAELRAAAIYGEPLPVWSGGCDKTIFSEPRVNHAFRAWHDALHLELDAGFDHDGELLLAVESVRIVLSCGLSQTDALMVFADVYGQFEYEAHHGSFPVDQAAFVAAYLAAPCNDKASAIARQF